MVREGDGAETQVGRPEPYIEGVPRLSYFHLLVWAVCAALAMAHSVAACLRYNEVAGTDKTARRDRHRRARD